MDLTSQSNEYVFQFLAARIRAERLRQGFSQSSFAKHAGITLRTYKRIELTGKGSVENLILILRALGRIRAVEILLPAPPQPKRHLSVVDRMKILALDARKK